MTPDKQRLYDAFIAGGDAVSNLPTVNADWIKEILRGRFEEWMDGQDDKDRSAEKEYHASKALKQAVFAKGDGVYTAGVHE